MSISGVNSTPSFLQSVNDVLSTVNKVAGGTVSLNDIGNMFQSLGNIVGSQSGSNASQSAALNKSIADLFNGGDPFAAENKKQADAAKAAAAGGGAMSLGALLALVGTILVHSIDTTMAGLKKAAQDLDSATSSGSGSTAAQNQKIQELTFNLQEIQQTLNRVNETVTNISKARAEAEKSITGNLRP